MKNKTVAALLAIFFGGFGVHKFYLRDTGTGVFYVFLFFMTAGMFRFPVSAILGFIDAIMLFSMSDEKFNQKYNKHLVNRSRDRYRRGYDNKRGRARQEPTVRGRAAQQQTRRTAQAPPSKRRQAFKDNPFKRSGLKKYKEFDLEAAIEDFHKGLEIEPNDMSLHWNLAAAYSLTEKAEKSYYHLSKAVNLGFKDFEKIRTHDDLAFLRIQEGFEAFAQSGFRRAPRGQSEIIDPKKEEVKHIPIEEADPMNDDILLSQLNKLAELRTKGLLTEKEFIEEKRKLLRE